MSKKNYWDYFTKHDYDLNVKEEAEFMEKMEGVDRDMENLSRDMEKISATISKVFDWQQEERKRFRYSIENDSQLINLAYNVIKEMKIHLRNDYAIRDQTEGYALRNDPKYIEIEFESQKDSDAFNRLFEERRAYMNNVNSFSQFTGKHLDRIIFESGLNYKLALKIRPHANVDIEFLVRRLIQFYVEYGLEVTTRTFGHLIRVHPSKLYIELLVENHGMAAHLMTYLDMEMVEIVD